MGKYYLIENNVITNIISVNDVNDLPGKTLIPFDPLIGDGVGYVLDNGSLTFPSESLTEYKNKLKAELAKIRWQQESSGTTFGELPVSTDITTQTKILGATMASILDNQYVVNWKTESGFVELNATQIIQLAQIIRAHIQSCFDNESALVELIDSATTKSELDLININSGWPS